MNFLVFFLIIATAIAASIPLETSNVIRRPSLTNSLAVAADNEERENLEQVFVAATIFAGVNIYLIYVKATLVTVVVMCALNPTDCSFFNPAPTANSLASINLENFATGDRQQTNGFYESFKLPSVSTIAKNAVIANNQRRPFPVTFPAFWNPYVNVPFVAFHHEMPNSNDPHIGSFIPKLNSFTRFNNPSLMDTLTPHAKLLVPVGTVSETTP
ncbi:Uncharacterized protein APZ42_033781 [Daphnia magna]|uniref:Uncharacterized protein n=1 Tax=Daphnia magna TaxID=35525 RepID=A0A164KWH9_9CRUS|nr:Uncharacterized protein APZ42_033781 [Daphnia magna]